MRQLSIAFALALVANVAFAQSNRNRFVIAFQPGTVVRPFGGGTLSLRMPPLFFGGSSFSYPFGSSSFTTFGIAPSSWMAPTFWIAPTFIAPQPFICLQFRVGNFLLLWCEPLQTSVVIIGRPFWWGPMVIDPLAPGADRATVFGRSGLRTDPGGMVIDPLAHGAERATAFGRSGLIIVDPIAASSFPQIWHNPLLQPGVMTFRLRHRSAEEVAKLLNESRILPFGRFVGLGDLLIASDPGLATSGVQRSRIRDIISALDKPIKSPATQPSSLTFHVEVFRTHAATCASQERLSSERATLLRLVGYPCAHPIGEADWRLSDSETLEVKGNEVEAILQAKMEGNLLRLSLNGKLGDKTVKQEGTTTLGKRPIIIVAPADSNSEALIGILTAK